jgi:16S rRNA (guanine966-N2)-methyltransferase
MRITGGSLRSRKLATPKGPLVEPAPDRVRESVFSILRNVVAGARVLDLFACSGSFGMEALSRDAQRALFVEKDAAAVRVIKRNLESLAVSNRAEVVCADALEILPVIEERGEAFQLAFVDPPYALSDGEESRAEIEKLLRGLLQNTAREGIVVFRQRKGEEAPLAGCAGINADTRAYGSTQVTFLQGARPS